VADRLKATTLRAVSCEGEVAATAIYSLPNARSPGYLLVLIFGTPLLSFIFINSSAILSLEEINCGTKKVPKMNINRVPFDIFSSTFTVMNTEQSNLVSKYF
jgi:hypothetical protein